MKKIIFVLALLTAISCQSDAERLILNSFKDGPTKEYFKVFHYVYKKNYNLNSEEGIYKYRVFKQNLKIIKETNEKNLSYKLGVNQFADLTNQEFKEKHLMNPEIKRKMITHTIRNLREAGYLDFDLYADKEESTEGFFNTEVNDTSKRTYVNVDHKNLFLSPRDQGNCGSCWTFATTGVIEAAVSQKTKVKTYLSVQQLVDCETKNNGCNGGMYPSAFDFARTVGIYPDSAYPYKQIQNPTCAVKNVTKTKITSYKFCSNYSNSPGCSEDSVYGFLRQRPIAVGIDGSVIQLYESGIFTEDCSEDNHAVILTGYGIENGAEYFNIRNSWGSGYGELGYIRVARNDGNNHSCFVTNEAFIPIV